MLFLMLCSSLCFAGEMIDYDWPAVKTAAAAGPGKALRKGGVKRSGSDEDSDFE